MTSLARRLDPCANWFRLLARTQGRVLWAFPAALLAAYLASVSGGDPFSGFVERRAQRAAMAPLLRAAAERPLGYEQAVACGSACLNRSVVWRLTRTAEGRGYVDGRPGWAFRWSNPHRVAAFGVQGTSPALALVAGFERDGVVLKFVGVP